MALTGFEIPHGRVRFGDCELNAEAFEVRRGRRTSKLERIPMQVLLLLIEEQGNLITREAIADHVWGKDVFVDVDNGINTAIRKIRQVLNDDPQRPRFIETIPGVGYRFIASLEQAAMSSAPPISETAALTAATAVLPEPVLHQTPSAPMPVVRWRRTAAALSGLFLIGGLGGWLAWRHFSGERHVIRSIAVLPLQNLSGDPSQEYFSDGMTEELITELSRIEPLRVISHTSVMDYKGTKKHLPEIARELNVDAILEGSVIRENDQVRVTVQLLDGPEDRHIWSEEYERPLHGVLNLERDVAQAVGQEVRIKLTPAERARFGTRQDLDPLAHENYLRGRYLLSTQFTLSAPLLQAKKYFENAIAKNPQYAEAYSGLADVHLYLALGRFEAPDVAFPLAHNALSRASELDDSVSEIHDTLGIIRWRRDLDFAGAEREFNRSISLRPSYACAHEDRAQYLAFAGKKQEALAELNKINTLDLGPSGQMTAAGVFYQLRDYPALIKTAKEGVALNPNEALEHESLGVGYEGIGKFAEAITEFKRAAELSGGDQDVSASLMYAYVALGDRQAATRIMREWENKSVSPYLMATMYASLDMRDKAFESLNEAFRTRSLELSWHIKADPRMDKLRTDPRFEQFVEGMKIPVVNGQIR
jgi:TolB-like protein/DNA-binding winged helix-turn-helix (wHTH) protein/Flp pilus assembly protein TadD